MYPDTNRSEACGSGGSGGGGGGGGGGCYQYPVIDQATREDEQLAALRAAPIPWNRTKTRGPCIPESGR
ncbi:hypothetical protein E2C01_089510 [Portunus trituberculatus]|uniref:Uncharacterized protein n=1 Tax=Portunus trituberculatus TaxID=210409 RepID=A0A5B7JJ81_PORTR|nr:hypothetical protein [Portunus trituberculatus]